MRSKYKVSVALVALALLMAACGSQAAPASSGGAQGPIQLAPISALSPEVRQLPADVQEAYRFALANPDVLSRIPCYCGCDRIGHMSNLDCYVVAGTAASGQPVFDSHASG